MGGGKKAESLILLTMATLGLELVRVRIQRKCPELPQEDTLRGHRGTPQALPSCSGALSFPPLRRWQERQLSRIPAARTPPPLPTT